MTAINKLETLHTRLKSLVGMISVVQSELHAMSDWFPIDEAMFEPDEIYETMIDVRGIVEDAATEIKEAIDEYDAEDDE